MPKKKDLDQIQGEKKDTRLTSGQARNTLNRTKDNKGQQPVASAEEQARRAAEMKTQGRKGCKMDRITISVTPENLQFIKIMSRSRGMTPGQFIGSVLDQYRQEHPAVYEQFKALQSLNEQLVAEDVKARKG